MIVKKMLAVIQVLLVLVFVACGGYIAKYLYDTHHAQDEYTELRQLVAQAQQEDASDGYTDKLAENGMLEKYYKLYKTNNHMTGWIKIENTKIDYPVVQYTDNEYYLHKDFYNKYQYSGIPFLDYQSKDTMNDIIYAHNMKDGSMFAALAEYEKQEFYDEHKLIKYDTLYDTGKYEIMAVFTTKVGSKNEFKYHEYADITTKERFDEYADKVKSLSKYDTGVTAEFGDKLLTLSTCAYHTSNERIVVVARKKYSRQSFE